MMFPEILVQTYITSFLSFAEGLGKTCQVGQSGGAGKANSLHLNVRRLSRFTLNLYGYFQPLM